MDTKWIPEKCMYFKQLRILLLSLIMTDLNNSGLFFCKKCNFKCSKNSNFLKHLSTRKHEMLTSNLQKNAETEFSCICGSNYKHRQSLHKHQKNCNSLKTNNLCNATVTDSFEKLTNLVLDVVKQNQELQKFITLNQK